MNTKNKTGKFRIIFRFLKGNIRFFVGTLLFSVLFTACNALIPQIVKYTADHILVLDGIPDGLNVRQTLLLAALLVAASAVLSGVFNYLSKMCLAKGSENFLKSIRDTLYHHTQYLPFSWHVKHQTGERDVNTYMSLNSAAKGPASEFPRTIEDEYEDILNLGKIFDCEDKAEEIVDQMKGEIDKVKEHVEGTDPLSVAVLEDEGDSFRVYGTETLGGNIPETLGAELKLGAENSENVGAEDLIAADPDVLFMINYDGFMTADEAIADITDNPAYASLSAVKNNKVFSVNLNEVYCSGVRTYDGIMTFAKALYPDLYE